MYLSGVLDELPNQFVDVFGHVRHDLNFVIMTGKDIEFVFADIDSDVVSF